MGERKLICGDCKLCVVGEEGREKFVASKLVEAHMSGLRVLHQRPRDMSAAIAILNDATGAIIGVRKCQPGTQVVEITTPCIAEEKFAEY